MISIAKQLTDHACDAGDMTSGSGDFALLAGPTEAPEKEKPATDPQRSSPGTTPEPTVPYTAPAEPSPRCVPPHPDDPGWPACREVALVK